MISLRHRVSRHLNAARAISLIALAVIAIGLPAMPVSAAADVELDAPESVEVGQIVHVESTITADGEPVAGGELALSFLGSINGESGWVTVATSTSDEDGHATFEFEQRALAGGRMRMEYFGPDGQENTEFAVTVVDGEQLVRSDAGADLPGLGVGWLLAVLAPIWVLMAVAASGLLKIGGGGDAGEPSRFVPRFAVGFIVFTAVGMFFVVLTRPVSHANLDPTSSFDRVPAAIVGAEYDYQGLGTRQRPADWDGLPSEQLYVQSGCASCHARRGTGGIVGPAIGGEELPGLFDDFLDEIRSGPKGMPAYTESALSDDVAAQIYDYLQSPAP